MGSIVGKFSIDGETAGRKGCTFKDGRQIRRVVPRKDGALEVYDTENKLLHRDTQLCGEEYKELSIGSLNAETSSFDGRLILSVDGFIAGTSGSLHLLVRTDYFIDPPVWFGQ